jgi:hypothetical protein
VGRWPSQKWMRPRKKIYARKTHSLLTNAVVRKGSGPRVALDLETGINVVGTSRFYLPISMTSYYIQPGEDLLFMTGSGNPVHDVTKRLLSRESGTVRIIQRGRYCPRPVCQSD